MRLIQWDLTGERFFETGISKGVLYPQVSGAYPKGVAWNGLTAVNESPSGAEPTPMYADNIKYLNLMSNEEFGATIEAYTYPSEFEACDGSASIAKGVLAGQQKRSEFGLAYKTNVGNDEDGDSHGYKIHLVWGALAAPTDKSYSTINDTPEGITFSWELTTTPVELTGFKPTASLTIDSRTVNAAELAAFEEILYGTAEIPAVEEPPSAKVDAVEARLPLPNELLTLFETT